MENKEIESGFKIVNILLVSSTFKREANVTFENSEIKHKFDIKVKVDIAGNVAYVTEIISLQQTLFDKVEFTAEIEMIGIFEQTGESSLDLKRFGHINGAAIIFPYLREHTTNICSKAGLGLIYLPSVNFTKLPESQEESK